MSEMNTMPEICTELADGTILNANCGFDGSDGVWIWMRDADDPDNNMTSMFSMFTNPEKTATIISHIRGKAQTFEGYTQLTILQLDYNGLVHVYMKVGEHSGK